MATVPLKVTSRTTGDCIRCGTPTKERIGVPTDEYPHQAMCKPCQKLPLKAGPHQRLRRYHPSESAR